MAGNLELLADRTVRGLLLAQWLPAWFVTGAESLIVPYAGSLGLPPSTASPLLAATPAGMLLGDVVVGRFCRPAVRQRLAFPLATLMGAPLLVLAFRPPLPVTGTVLFACGFGSRGRMCSTGNRVSWSSSRFVGPSPTTSNQSPTSPIPYASEQGIF